MIKKLLIASSVALVLSGLQEARAQQDPYYSHFNFNKLAYNPATAGSNDAICANLLAHTQWVGLSDQAGPIDPEHLNEGNKVQKGVGPKTYSANISGPLTLGKTRSGIGFSIVSDNIAYQDNLNFKLSYAYYILPKQPRKGPPKTGRFSIGLDFGFLQKSLDGKSLNPKDPTDPKIPKDRVSTGLDFDLGGGIYYTNSKFFGSVDFSNFYAGLSATHITQPTVTYSGNGFSLDSKEVLHYYFVTGVDYQLGANMVLNPNVLVKINAVTQVDVNALLTYANKFSGGLGFRTLPKNSDAITILLGFIPKQGMRVGYSYDITLNGLRTSSSGTHEIFFSYCFKLPHHTPPAKLRRTPRHL